MLKVGQRVRINYPLEKGDKAGITPEMMHFNGTETRVSKTMARVLGKSTSKVTVKTYYLEGIESEMGMPFEFVDGWLIPFDEVTE